MDSAEGHHHLIDLKQINKVSHKISKPIKRTTNPLFEFNPQQKKHHNQPPQVYKIDKNDFRYVVQKLTSGISSKPPPPVSRLQSIRPPPLTRPSSLLPLPTITTAFDSIITTTNKNEENGRKVSPALSPLPPFPAIHFAEESPISAYMRYLKTSNLTNEFESKKPHSESPRTIYYNHT